MIAYDFNCRLVGFCRRNERGERADEEILVLRYKPTKILMVNFSIHSSVSNENKFFIFKIKIPKLEKYNIFFPKL